MILLVKKILYCNTRIKIVKKNTADGGGEFKPQGLPPVSTPLKLTYYNIYYLANEINEQSI